MTSYSKHNSDALVQVTYQNRCGYWVSLSEHHIDRDNDLHMWNNDLYIYRTGALLSAYRL